MADAAPGGLELRRVQPEGYPLDIGFADEPPLRFSFDAKGRVVAGKRGTYAHGTNGQTTRTHGKVSTKMQFDDQGRIVVDDGTKRTYDKEGRLLRAVTLGGRFIAYNYAADGTYKTSHNYPDRDEFCEADLVEVKRDERGLIVLDRFDGCGINETPHTLHYHYDDADRIIRIDVDLGSNGNIDGIVRLRHC